MKLYLPVEKVDKIKAACQTPSDKNAATLREIAHATALLVSAFPAVQYLELFHKSTEFCKSHELHLGTTFDKVKTISQQTKGDLTWIVYNIDSINGKPFNELPVDLSVESDTSASGWSASCNGVSAYGHWSSSESGNYINYLELLAAFFALQSFFPMHKSAKHIRLKLDNTPAVAYINHFGSIKSPSLNSISGRIWH